MNTQLAPGIRFDSARDPYRTSGIVSLVLAFLQPYLGLVLGIYAYRASAKAGYDNDWARWGAGIGGVFTLLIIVFATSMWLGILN